MKLKKRLVKYKPIEVPYNVWRFIGSNSKYINEAGNAASLGEDYGTIYELRNAIEWYVDQLGGKVKWDVVKKEK